MLSSELVQNLNQAVVNFVARIKPPKFPVTIQMFTDLLNTTDPTGLYFYVTDTNIPETLDAEELNRPYVVNRIVNGSQITLTAQSLHNGNAQYENSTSDGITWTGWSPTAGVIYRIITGPTGVLVAEKL